MREAIQVELKRVFEDFKTVQHVPKSQVEEDVRRFGAVKVHLKDALIPVKVKYNTEGELTKIKARFVVTDRVVDGKMPDVYAPAISGDTVRYTCNLQLQIRGVAAVKDVQGAYHHGKPRDPGHPNGRSLYARVAPGLKEFGYPRWVDGVEYVVKIVGNVPGRQDAGVVWGDAYTTFLKECGFTQSVVDRRLRSNSVASACCLTSGGSWRRSLKTGSSTPGRASTHPWWRERSSG